LTTVMGLLRLPMLSWLARRYLAGPGGMLDLSNVSRLPDSVLWPLRRTGLDPIEELGRRREQEPVSRLTVPFGIKAWLVTGYDEVRAVLSAGDAFSNDFSNLTGSTGVPAQHNPGGLGFADPPVHTRLRRLLTPEFTMRRLARLRPRIDAIITEQLDAMAVQDATGDPVDLWQSFALPIPSLTICELLGVPYGDRAEFQMLSTARFDMAGDTDASLGAMTQSVAYLLDLVARQRSAPGDGLLGGLIREHGAEIDDLELAGLADGVLTGGLETSASMLALGALVLMNNPATADQIRAGQGIDSFVEELLRYLTVVQVAFPRFATRDIVIGGVAISAGDGVVCSLSGANRDGSLGTGMERFDPGRTAAPHLAFGYGIHRCVGAELARMELRAAYPALVRRFPAMRLLGDPADLTFRDTSIVYGVEALPVRL
jgi:cytochrome P450